MCAFVCVSVCVCVCVCVHVCTCVFLCVCESLNARVLVLCALQYLTWSHHSEVSDCRMQLTILTTITNDSTLLRNASRETKLEFN